MAPKVRKKCSLAGIDERLILPGRTRSKTEYLQRLQHYERLKASTANANDFNAMLEAQIPRKIKGFALAQHYLYARIKRLAQKSRSRRMRRHSRRRERAVQEAEDEALCQQLWDELIPRSKSARTQVVQQEEQEAEPVFKRVPPEQWVCRTPEQQWIEDRTPSPCSPESTPPYVNGMCFEMSGGGKLYYEMNNSEGMRVLTPAAAPTPPAAVQQADDYDERDNGEFSLSLDWNTLDDALLQDIDNAYAHAQNGCDYIAQQ